MAWIESHQAVGHHPKTIRFAELLRVNLPTAVGHLHYFWWWALDFAPQGEIRTTPTVLARACEWRGNADRFVQALVTAGFLEEREDRVVIHDWMDYAGRLFEKRAANAQRMQSARAKHVQRTNGARDAHVQGLPLTNQPEPTVPDHPPYAPPTENTHVQRTNGVCCELFAISGSQHANSCQTLGSA